LEFVSFRAFFNRLLNSVYADSEKMTKGKQFSSLLKKPQNAEVQPQKPPVSLSELPFSDTFFNRLLNY